MVREKSTPVHALFHSSKSIHQFLRKACHSYAYRKDSVKPSSYAYRKDSVKPSSYAYRKDSVKPSSYAYRKDSVKPSSYAYRKDSVKPSSYAYRKDSVKPSSSAHIYTRRRMQSLMMSSDVSWRIRDKL